jgi:hypothetical protein
VMGLEKICPSCVISFRSCEHCWRGHKYCSPDCSREGRKRNRRITEKRYTTTEKGRESRRCRQKNFRSRNILGLKITDHSIESAPTAGGISKNGNFENNVIPFKNKKPTDSKLSVPCSRVVNYGEGSVNIVELSVLAISKSYTACWKKKEIDLTELAHKRWVEKWTVARLVVHFGFGRTAVMRYLRKLRESPELIVDAEARSLVVSRKRSRLVVYECPISQNGSTRFL